MAAQITVRGTVATYDGQSWASDDADLAKLCQITAEMLPPDHYPDPVGDLAEAVAIELGGALVRRDPVPSDDAPEDAVY